MASAQAERYLASLPIEDQQAIRAGGDVDAWYNAAVAAGAVPQQFKPSPLSAFGLPLGQGDQGALPAFGGPAGGPGYGEKTAQANVAAGGGKPWWEMSAEEAGINPWTQDYKQEFDRTSTDALAQMSPEQRARWSMEHLDRLDYRTPESSWQQWMAWQDSFDPSCPPNAPYRAEDGSGCVEKPDNSNAGYQAGAGGGGGGRGGGGGNGGGGGGWKNGTAGPLPEFQYTPFQAPSYEQAMADPGYQFSVKEGLDKLQASAAARGVLRSGGTLKDIAGWSQDRAAQQYGDVYNRALQTWGAQYQGEKDAFAPQYGGWQTMYGGDLSRWTTNQNAALQKYLQREGNIFGLMNYGFPSY